MNSGRLLRTESTIRSAPPHRPGRGKRRIRRWKPRRRGPGRKDPSGGVVPAGEEEEEEDREKRRDRNVGRASIRRLRRKGVASWDKVFPRTRISRSTSGRRAASERRNPVVSRRKRRGEKSRLGRIVVVVVVIVVVNVVVVGRHDPHRRNSGQRRWKRTRSSGS